MVNRRPSADDQKDDQKEERISGAHPGDMGVIIIAALFTIALILMFFMPSPFAKMDAMRAATAKAERQKEIDKAVASGEVSVGIAPAKDH
jgi:hypothetical protein